MLTFLSCFVSIGCTALAVHPSVEKQEAFNQRLVFSSNRDGNWEIYYMMNADGSHQVNLTNNPADDHSPIWSPDAKRIAFVSNRDGNEEIYVMNIDGSEVKRLTQNPGADVSPSWAPNCSSCHGSHDRISHVPRTSTRRLLLLSERGGQRDIYMMDLDDSAEMDLTRTDGVDETDPSWMVEDQHIVF